MRIVFMGTPEFAVVSLKKLIASTHEVVAVVTAPDAVGGRGGKQLIQSDVKKYALTLGLPLLQPERLRDPHFIKLLNDFNADIQIVVAFRMLPEIIWSMPPLGTYNIHGSLLPKYRGAAPIHWAVINGETKTGVTIFKLKHEIDTGDIIMQSSIDIGPNETTGEVYERLMVLGAESLLKSLELIANGHVHYMEQDDVLSSSAPKLFHEGCAISMDWASGRIHNFIRGLNPKPTAWMRYANTKYFLHRSALTAAPALHEKRPGTLYIDNNHLYLKTIDGQLDILEIQQEGKRKMSASDFINGMHTHVAFL